MTSPGRDLRFGIAVTPYAETYRQVIAQVTAAERCGLDLVGIQDHPYQRRFLDTFLLIGDLWPAPRACGSSRMSRTSRSEGRS